MKVAFLACADVLTTTPKRRVDAYEHDRELEAFTPAFAARGLELTEVDWRACDPAAFDLIFLRTCWDYTDHEAEFLAFLDRAQAVSRVANDPTLVRWNLSKLYLRELAAKGLPVIPSLFTDTAIPLAEAFERLGADELVLKPVVGSSGFGQARTALADARGQVLEPDRFAQPLIPEISTWGEVSLIFAGGVYSHAVRKTAGAGDYRIHVMHGGAEHAHQASAAEIAVGQAFIDALPVQPLAARVDLVPHGGGWLLMEVEAIEPHLFPQYAPDLGERLAQAILTLATASPTARP